MEINKNDEEEVDHVGTYFFKKFIYFDHFTLSFIILFYFNYCVCVDICIHLYLFIKSYSFINFLS
jgi:hypothetical protein